MLSVLFSSSCILRCRVRDREVATARDVLLRARSRCRSVAARALRRAAARLLSYRAMRSRIRRPWRAWSLLGSWAWVQQLLLVQPRALV